VRLQLDTGSYVANAEGFLLEAMQWFFDCYATAAGATRGIDLPAAPSISAACPRRHRRIDPLCTKAGVRRKAARHQASPLTAPLRRHDPRLLRPVRAHSTPVAMRRARGDRMQRAFGTLDLTWPSSMSQGSLPI
jgi:hypothetical protein